MKPTLKKRIVRVMVILMVLVSATITWIFIVTPAQRAERAKINERGFAAIAMAQNWDIKQNMLWGFYFTNKSKLSLQLCSKILGVGGYHFVDIRRDENIHLWWLHMERTEILNVDRLSVRDVRLSRIAVLSGFCTYDGWDVGLVN